MQLLLGCEPIRIGFPAKLSVQRPTFGSVESHAWGGEMISNVIDFVTKARKRDVCVGEADVSGDSRGGRVNSAEIRELFADVFEEHGRNSFLTAR